MQAHIALKPLSYEIFDSVSAPWQVKPRTKPARTNLGLSDKSEGGPVTIVKQGTKPHGK